MVDTAAIVLAVDDRSRAGPTYVRLSSLTARWLSGWKARPTDSIGRMPTIHQTSDVSPQRFADHGNRCGE
jgi:hypothetical protein